MVNPGVGNASRNKTNEILTIFGDRTLTGNSWREMLKQTIFDISQEKRQPVCGCHNNPDRKGRTKDGRL